jgi:hypothetical protein
MSISIINQLYSPFEKNSTDEFVNLAEDVANDLENLSQIVKNEFLAKTIRYLAHVQSRGIVLSDKEWARFDQAFSQIAESECAKDSSDKTRDDFVKMVYEIQALTGKRFEKLKEKFLPVLLTGPSIGHGKDEALSLDETEKVIKKAKKVVLSASLLQSEVLSRMIKSGFQEKREGIHFDALQNESSFDAVVAYFKNDKNFFQKITLDTVSELFDFARKYMCDNLQKACLKFILLQLNDETERSQSEQAKYYQMQESFIATASSSITDENLAEKAICTSCLVSKLSRLSESEKLEFIKSLKQPNTQSSSPKENESLKPSMRFPKKSKLTLQQEAVQIWARGELQILPKAKKVQFFDETIHPLLLEEGYDFLKPVLFEFITQLTHKENHKLILVQDNTIVFDTEFLHDPNKEDYQALQRDIEVLQAHGIFQLLPQVVFKDQQNQVGVLNLFSFMLQPLAQRSDPLPKEIIFDLNPDASSLEECQEVWKKHVEKNGLQDKACFAHAIFMSRHDIQNWAYNVTISEQLVAFSKEDFATKATEVQLQKLENFQFPLS